MRGRLLAVAAALSMVSLSSGAVAQSAAPLIGIIALIYVVTKDDDPASP